MNKLNNILLVNLMFYQISSKFISNKYSLPDCEKKELEKEILNMRSVKIPIIYPDIKKKKF